MRIGAHESIAGGLHLAFERGEADGAEAIQIFSRSSRQWTAKPITSDDAAAFRREQARTSISVIAHDSYLINLGADPGDVRAKSVAAFHDELERCEALGIPWLVAHPGANENESEGLRLIAEAVREALEATRGYRVGVLFEITAGQGVALGYRFSHLAELLARVAQPERSGVCLDTCHLYAAGYDIATEPGYAATMDELDRLIGSRHVKAMHLNDSKKGLDCRVDRHEQIGKGALGQDAFARFVQDPRFSEVTAVLETPEGHWKEEIALLRSLRDGVAPKKQVRRALPKQARRVAKREKLPAGKSKRAAARR